MSKTIKDDMSQNEFFQYVKEFMLHKNNFLLSFKDWVIMMANTEWELNTGEEKYLFNGEKSKEQGRF